MKTVLCITLIGAAISNAASAAQQCVHSIQPTSPNSQYRANNDGTINDLKHNLMWLTCSVGQQWKGEKCQGDLTTATWDKAVQIAEHYHYAGYLDWRLPTIHELSSLAELQCLQPAINLSLFPATPATDYWTSTSFSNNAKLAWRVHFQYGENHTAVKNHQAAIRLVRSIAP